MNGLAMNCREINKRNGCEQRIPVPGELFVLGIRKPDKIWIDIQSYYYIENDKIVSYKYMLDQ